MNKKGQVIAIVIAMGVLLGILLIFWAWSLIAPQAVSIAGDITTGVRAGFTDNQQVTDAIDNSIIPVNTALSGVQWVTYGLLFFLMFGFIVSMFFVRSYPFILPVWIIFMIILVFFAIVLSDSYIGVSSGTSQVAQIYRSWRFNHFLMSNLPSIITILGTVTSLVMFISITRDSEQEATVL